MTNQVTNYTTNAIEYLFTLIRLNRMQEQSDKITFSFEDIQSCAPKERRDNRKSMRSFIGCMENCEFLEQSRRGQWRISDLGGRVLVKLDKELELDN